MGTHPIFESDFDCLTEVMSFEKQRNICSVLIAETSEMVNQLASISSQDQFESLNYKAVKKLRELQTATSDLQLFCESANQNKAEMIHECKQIEETVNRLHKDLRKRLSEVETRLSSQNRSDLLSGGSADSNSRAAVEGKEAAIRLRKVNDDVGRIIKGGQAAQERLVDSSEVLKSTKGELASGSDHLKNAKRLLEKLERRKWIDKIIFIACLAFFFATCVYILLKRFTPRFLINCLLYFIPTGWFEMILKSNGETIDEDISHSEL